MSYPQNNDANICSFDFQVKNEEIINLSTCVFDYRIRYGSMMNTSLSIKSHKEAN